MANIIRSNGGAKSGVAANQDIIWVPEIVTPRSLQFFRRKLLQFGMFAQDFSPEIRKHGDTVITRNPGYFEAKDFDVDPTTSNTTETGYDPVNTNDEETTVTLDTHIGIPWTYHYNEIHDSVGNLGALLDTHMEPAVDALVRKVFERSFGLLTTQTWATGRNNGDTANMDTRDIQNVFEYNDQATGAKFDTSVTAQLNGLLGSRHVPKTKRGLILGSSYHASLISDPIVAKVNESGNGRALYDAEILRIRNFDVVEVPELVSNVQINKVAADGRGIKVAADAKVLTSVDDYTAVQKADGSWINTAGTTTVKTGSGTATVKGIAIHPQALMMVNRPVFNPGAAGGIPTVAYKNLVTDSGENGTGFSYNIMMHDDPDRHRYRFYIEARFGFALAHNQHPYILIVDKGT